MKIETKNDIAAKKPKWIKVKLPIGKKYTELRSLVEKNNLNTICTSGSCPNMGECWGEGTATFMILGIFVLDLANFVVLRQVDLELLIGVSH